MSESRNVDSVFQAAIELDSDVSRTAFVREACGNDDELRHRVDRLLAAHLQAGRFMSITEAVSPSPDQPIAEQVGTLIGPYKLLEQIGEGGMGLVYMAEQQQPVRRLVALKIIKPGMDSKQVIARFEAERQALAMMDHPNIAKVHDAGTTETGRPFFVMELVRGVPLNEFCDQKRLTVRERLQLFIQVCHAVQHAHQKGIIHRDLKPTNVLVGLADTVAFPKLLDFGIAKALGQSLTDNTLHTGYSQLVGTPLYMSPEQAEMNLFGVDTRSDVYSLGVLLYELLTGTTPFDTEKLTKASFDEMRRIIREDDPPRPSARMSTLKAQTLSTISQQRNIDSRRISATLRGELDWIVMKSLEKDRSRRYESASALAADIQRYLSDEPVLACPPTTMYRFQKFARKHQPALVTAAAIAVCLILGTTVSAWQAVRATAAEAQASANEQKANVNAVQAQQQAQEANAQRDEAQRQRDEVKTLYDKLAAREQELQRTLYASNINLAKHAWDAGSFARARELLAQTRPKSGETDFRGFEWHYLFRRSQGALLTIPQARNIHSVVSSPDGKRLATAGRPGVKVWDIQTGKEILSLKGGASASGDFQKCLAYSPDGKRLAAFGGDTPGSAGSRPMTVWNAETGNVLYSIDAECLSIAFSPDGKRLAAAGWLQEGERLIGEVKIRDSETGQAILTLRGARGGVAFSPDGKRLYSNTKVWDSQTGQELLSLKGHVGSVSAIAYSPDGKWLASASYSSKTLKVWDAQNGEELTTVNGSAGNAIAFSPDGKRIVSSWTDKSVKVLEAPSGQELLSFEGEEYAPDLAFSPDGKQLITAGENLKVWDAYRDQQPLALNGSDSYQVSSVAFSPDGKHLASSVTIGAPWTATKLGEGTWWNATTGESVFSFTGHTRNINAVAVSPDGKRLATLSLERRGKPGQVKIWNAQTGEELLSLPFKGAVGNQQTGSVAFSPDSKHVATCGGEIWPRGPGEVKIWDANTGTELQSIHDAAYVEYVAYSPDGKRLAGCMRGARKVKVWDAQSGQELQSISGGDGGLAFSPNGNRLASGGRVWDAQTGRLLLTLKGHAGWVSQTVFSPDGKRIATASSDNTVKLWDVHTGAELMTFPGGDVVAFSADSHRLATATSGGKVLIYDATPLPEKP
jgi:eukaryotic-like serine/threonine-protein kinase